MVCHARAIHHSHPANVSEAARVYHKTPALVSDGRVAHVGAGRAFDGDFAAVCPRAQRENRAEIRGGLSSAFGGGNPPRSSRLALDRTPLSLETSILETNQRRRVYGRRRPVFPCPNHVGHASRGSADRGV